MLGIQEFHNDYVGIVDAIDDIIRKQLLFSWTCDAFSVDGLHYIKTLHNMLLILAYAHRKYCW